jgi:conjugative relaxase-like TrwC/TraI family protein
MLSISALSGDQGDYYLKLARDDYYLKGGEPRGLYLGQGAEALGLSGHVKERGFKFLLGGFSPNGKELIQNAGKPNHQAGWDLTFSSDKSISVLWCHATPGVRKAIQEAQLEAVKEAISYLQESAAFTRRGKAGREIEKAKLIVAAFEHGTSRAQDPQLHTHCLILNVSVREDGTTGTILSKPLYLHKMAAGAVYRAELASQLEKKLGLALERDPRNFAFKVKGVPENLISEFSKRRKQVEKALAEHGATSAKAAAKLALATRPAKGVLSRSELLSVWQEVGRLHGFTAEVVNQLLMKQGPRLDLAERLNACIQAAIQKITGRAKHFLERDLVREASVEAQAMGISASLLRDALKQKLLSSSEFLCLGRVNGEIRYTTRAIPAVEKKLPEKTQGPKTFSPKSLAEKPIRAVERAQSQQQEPATEHLLSGETRMPEETQGPTALPPQTLPAKPLRAVEGGQGKQQKRETEPLLSDELKNAGKRTEADPKAVTQSSGKAQIGKKEGPRRELVERADKCIEASIQKITRQHSHFSERDVLRHAAIAAQAVGISTSLLREALRRKVLSSPELVRLGRAKGTIRYTTREMLDLEKKMLDQVERLKALPSRSVAERTVRSVEGRLNDEQKKAVRHLTQSSGQIQVVSGMAGTGKTSMLRAVREAFEKEGFEVIGACLSGKAAQGLEAGAGIKSCTVAKLIGIPEFGYRGDLEKGFLDTVKHHAHQLGRAALGKKTWKEERIRLTSKSVLVIDEAAMLGTRQMEKLTEKALAAGARLILVGDERQLQAIDAGGPFASIGARLGRVTLTDIKRQLEPWAREAIRKIAFGEGREALREYASRGLVSVTESRQDAMQALVRAWKREGAANPKDNLILASTNAESTTLNRMAQTQRMLAGQLGKQALAIDGSELHRGDRIVFTRNSKQYGVANGSLGIVTEVDAKRQILTVRLDHGRHVLVPVKDYGHLKLGYSLTTHKSQGATTENAYVLLGGPCQDRELSYVQASRAIKSTRFFLDKLEAGEDLEKLCQQIERSRQKDLAHDIDDQRGREYRGQQLNQ